MTFKHILLPVWVAAYRYRRKTYRFVVNGRTGAVQGERPWSRWKIALAFVVGVIVTLGVLYAMQAGGAFEGMGGGGFYPQAPVEPFQFPRGLGY